MLKKIDASHLRVGMFIHNFDCGWMAHPFIRNRFVITCDEEIRKIQHAGIRCVTIDCARGLDVADAPTLEEARVATEADVAAIAAKLVASLRVTLAEEFDVVRKHPKDGYDILRRTSGIGPVPLDITLHHHERRDGAGYLDRQDERTISEFAQMAAIVDAYDAITADRCYHKGMPAAEALRKMYEWSKFHFDPQLVQEFMRCVGIYSIGALVLLESGRLGTVVEPHETSLLTPKVNVFYSTKSKTYIKPETVDLARGTGFGGGDRIVRHESAEKWKVDPHRFMVLQ